MTAENARTGRNWQLLLSGAQFTHEKYKKKLRSCGINCDIGFSPYLLNCSANDKKERAAGRKKSSAVICSCKLRKTAKPTSRLASYKARRYFKNRSAEAKNCRWAQFFSWEKDGATVNIEFIIPCHNFQFNHLSLLSLLASEESTSWHVNKEAFDIIM